MKNAPATSPLSGAVPFNLPTLTLTLTLAFALLGCESRISLGQRCDSTANCQAPLICAIGGRCRVECTTSADCPAGERCLVDGAGVPACSVDRETCTTDCAEGLECVRGECQSGCTSSTECPDSVCTTEGYCLVPARLDAGPIDAAGEPDAWTAPDTFDPAECRPAPPIADVDVGLESVCAITTEGVAYCWGYYAVVGPRASAGACSTRTGCYPRPVEIAGVPRLSQLTVGSGEACGISRETATLGQVWCWGEADFEPIAPRAITDELGVPIHASLVDAGRVFACALTTEATPRVRCWGSQAHGMLGNGVLMDSTSSVAVVATELGSPDPDGLRVSAWASFARHGAVLDAVGENDDAELADPDSPSLASSASRDLGAALTGLAPTADNTCVLVGTAPHCWGRYGTLSHPVVEPPACRSGAACTYAETVFDTVPLVAIAGDPYGDSVLGWNAAGIAFGWGSSYGALLAAPNVETIQPLTALGGEAVTDLAVGDHTACAILRAGSELRCWGLNDDGQLGRGTVDDQAHAVAEGPCW